MFSTSPILLEEGNNVFFDCHYAKHYEFISTDNIS